MTCNNPSLSLITTFPKLFCFYTQAASCMEKSKQIILVDYHTAKAFLDVKIA